MKRILAILLTTLSLQACLPLAFVAGAVIGGMVIYDKRSIQTMMDDETIGYQIREKIHRDDSLAGSHIIVASFNRVVLLAGQTNSPAKRQRIVEYAESVKNVRRIYDEIRVSGASSTLSRSGDNIINTKVRTAMLAKAGLKSSQIKSVVSDSTVYLMGIVTHKQADLAVDVARKVPGVRRVVKIFEYNNY